jgi:hypothetical protein
MGSFVQGQRFMKLAGRLGYGFDEALRLKKLWKAMYKVNRISPEEFLMELSRKQIEAYDPFDKGGS